MNTFQNMGGLTMSFASAVLSFPSTSTYTTTTSTAAQFKGAWGTPLTAQTAQATPTADAATGLAFPTLAANQATVVVLGVNKAGAIKMCQGSIVPTEVGVTTTAGAFILAPQFPIVPDDFAPLGYALVRTSPTGSAFTAGTTSWTASGITTSAVTQIGTMPERPQIA